jgi:uncharacterized protein
MIIYLHGFASSGKSDKAQKLIDRFGQDSVWNPDLPHDPKLVCELVKDKISDWFTNSTQPSQEKLIFVGTSLGAFYATYFAFLFDAPCVIVNPSVLPHDSLKRKLGKNKNHVTQEEFVVSLCDLDELELLKNSCIRNYNGSLVTLFIAKDDEVLDYKQILDYYMYTKSTTVMETGGHRFTEHWDKVVDKVAELM